MPDTDPVDPARPPPSLFLSYASEDRQAAKLLRDALLGYGLEVWYDESGLDGGDAWDQKIRRQIRECDFFMPVISAQTAARAEGYFRREWRLAVERTLDMADDHPFLLPVVIDDTTQAAARVPDRFLNVQWMRVPGGRATEALQALCRRLLAGQAVALQLSKPAPDEPGPRRSGSRAREYPPFPREEPGQRAMFWLHVLGWALQSAWTFFRRFPAWVRILVYIWLAIVFLSKACTPSSQHAERTSATDVQKIKQLADSAQNSPSATDAAKLGAQIAQEVSNEVAGRSAARSSLLVIPFGGSSDDAAGKKLADSAFEQTFGRVTVSRHGPLDLLPEPSSSLDPSEMAELGREHHASYVLYGSVDHESTPASLVVRIVSVADGSVAWSASYPVVGADAARIAADIDAKVRTLK
jgi:TolB-like protein